MEILAQKYPVSRLTTHVPFRPSFGRIGRFLVISASYSGVGASSVPTYRPLGEERLSDWSDLPHGMYAGWGGGISDRTGHRGLPLPFPSGSACLAAVSTAVGVDFVERGGVRWVVECPSWRGKSTQNRTAGPRTNASQMGSQSPFQLLYRTRSGTAVDRNFAPTPV